MHYFDLSDVRYYRQEGWRLEHEDPHDQSSPIVFKGIVFNEMKGVFVSLVNKSSLAFCYSIGIGTGSGN